MMNMLLGWMRALTDAVWRLVESPSSNRFLSGFGTGWLVIALVLIGAGIVIDWIIWMIRWQPYHIWATRLRAVRRLFGRTVEIVEPVGYDYDTMQYMPAGPVQVERRQTARFDEALAEIDDEPYGADGDPNQDYGYGYNAEAEEQYKERYEEQYEEGCEAYDAHRAYAQDDADADPHAAYRRPALQFPTPPLIPDSQLGDYPGKRYDPARMPQVPPRDTVLAPLDPLAPYDAYPGAPAAQPAQRDPLDAPSRGKRERAGGAGRRAKRRAAPDADGPVAGESAAQDAAAAGRRRRRTERAAEELPAQDPQLQADEDLAVEWVDEPAEKTIKALRRRAPNNLYRLFGEPEPAPEPAPQQAYEEPHEEPYEEAYEDTYEEAYGEAYPEEAFDAETFDADDLPDAPKWPQWDGRKASQRAAKQPKGSILEGMRKMGQKKSDPYGTKKRGMIAQMLDPQVDSIKGLPPMVDVRSAFQKPTYPEPYGREPEGDGNPWDEDI